MAEPVQVPQAPPRSGRRDPERVPLDVADFLGCRAVHIPRDDIEDYDGRVEYWEARTGTAMVVCGPTSTYTSSRRTGWPPWRL